MKHSLSITLMLVGFFVVAQIFGVLIVNQYVDVQKSVEMGETVFKDLPTVGGVVFERPDVEENVSFLYVFLAILVGTVILLLMIKFAKWLWKPWFFMAISLSLYFAFAPFVPVLFAGVLALFLAAMKLIGPRSMLSITFGNIAELFIYGGLSAIFVPIFNLWAVSGLLLLISLWDMWAVWKGGVMVTMAKHQISSGAFAGLSIPYVRPKVMRKTRKKSTKKHIHIRAGKKAPRLHTTARKEKMSTAILGGGDIAIPLFFTATVLKAMGLISALLVIPFTTIALFMLLYFAEQNKFYPAMPFLSGGCFVGFAVVWLLQVVGVLA
ncbi:hypothetical protein GF342_05860 [Candidatus Woesearchaeota archaeon]|nr:hypothetical protein [Candidatus Woesearchaeota archaeon]